MPNRRGLKLYTPEIEFAQSAAVVVLLIKKSLPSLDIPIQKEKFPYIGTQSFIQVDLCLMTVILTFNESKLRVI